MNGDDTVFENGRTDHDTNISDSVSASQATVNSTANSHSDSVQR